MKLILARDWKKFRESYIPGTRLWSEGGDCYRRAIKDVFGINSPIDWNSGRLVPPPHIERRKIPWSEL